MKTIILMLLLIVATTNAQFKYVGDSVWTTNTKTVLQVRQNYNDLNYYYCKSDSLEDVVRTLLQAKDTTEKQIARLKKLDTLNKERIEEQRSAIWELMQPVGITVPEKSIVYNGTYGNLGAHNNFPQNELRFLRAFQFYGSAETSITIKDKVRTGIELKYIPGSEGKIPFDLSVKLGIRVF
jgi:hypothetical protein